MFPISKSSVDILDIQDRLFDWVFHIIWIICWCGTHSNNDQMIEQIDTSFILMEAWPFNVIWIWITIPSPFIF